jgi:hypothetical protein
LNIPENPEPTRGFLMTPIDRSDAEERPGPLADPTAAKQASAVVEYRLDEHDRITEVNESWKRFALENGGENLIAENVIGRSLRDFISGDVTRMFVSALLQSTRLTGKERTINYRCDSAEVKRFMAMDIVPVNSGELISRHRVLRELKLPVSIPFTAIKSGQKALIKRCSMCNRLTKGGSPLIEPEDAERLGWLDQPASALVIYSVCRDCAALVARTRASA